MKQAIINALKAVALWALQGIIGAVFVLGAAIVMVEWFAGCGETYVDSNGKRHAHECLFLPQQNTTKGDKTPPNT